MKEFTEEEIKAWILRQLGHPTITVELTQEQLGDAANDALEQFNRYRSRVMVAYVPLYESGSYDFYAESSQARWPWYGDAASQARLPTGVGPGLPHSTRYRLEHYGRGLYDVSAGKRNILDWSLRFGFPIPIEYRTFTFAIEKYEAYLMWEEEASRLFSTEFDWKWIEPYLYVANIPWDAEVLYYTYFDGHIFSSVPHAWHKWIKDYSLAEAKAILARVRGKYQNVPTPGGGAQLDGTDLQTQAETAREQLLEDLRNSRQSLPPMWG